MTARLIPIIMAGGSGTRLWPVSRDSLPKQFISLLGSGFIHLAWLGLIGLELWWALALSLVYAVCVFRFV